ncbi:MAG: hypothetical protein L0229_20315 [Blastocatellia bacterium]|nr:hypothetical protein [Blastocatellia bacterium]
MTVNMKPSGIDDAITEHAGFSPRDGAGMTDEEIRGYFTPENFASMFHDDDISDWPWTWDELAERAIELARSE